MELDLEQLRSAGKRILARNHISLESRRIRQLQRLLLRTKNAVGRLYSADLGRLCRLHGAGKHAWYPALYERHLSHLRHQPLNLLEIGIGGYEHPHVGGGSLRMWKSYFPHASVFGVDLHDKSPLDEHRIRTFRGSQADPEFLRRVAREIGRVDIVIDDGSHLNSHVLTSFEVLFPLLASPGIYVIEDTQTAYWNDWGGSDSDRNSPLTSMGFLKGLVDGLNYRAFTAPEYRPTYYEANITSVHFHHNIVFIEKASNECPRSEQHPA